MEQPPQLPSPPTQPTQVIVTANRGKATAGMVLGIIGLFAWFIPLVGFPVNIVGIVMSSKGLESAIRGRATAGLVLSIIGLVLSAINSFAGVLMSMGAI